MMKQDCNIIIKAENLTKTFTDFWRRPKIKAVDGISFFLSRNEILGLLGPNGSGKSTTIKMILGLLYPTKGSIEVLGHSPKSIIPKKKIGYLPEESYLYNFLTARETLEFFGSLFKLSRIERKIRAKQLLQMVGLSHHSKKKISEFSKGMVRRIGIAQAMINNPELIILDEPTSGLDPIACKEIKELIIFLKDQGKTILICSHLLSDLEQICDRAIILCGGKIIIEGNLEKLLKKQNTHCIKAHELSDEIIDKLLDFLQEQKINENIIIESDKNTLENFFLEIIKKSDRNIGGADYGGKIADYLKKSKNQ